MKTERCSQCGNMVVGSFNPSTARTYLTKIAKKGGMKALLATVGSVIPGFGTIAGFLTGTVIDVMYGKNIDKFIDKAIDAFQDKKVYVFTCPNCGKSWTNKYDTIEDAILTFDIDDRVEDDIDDRVEEIEESIESAKNYYLLSESFVTRALEAFELIEKASKDFQDFIEGSLDTDKIEECEEAQEQITELMLEFILWISENCKGSMESPIAVKISNADKNESLSMRIHGAYPIFQGEGYLLVAVIHTGILRVNDKISFADMEIPVEMIGMFGKNLDQAEAGDVCTITIPSTITDNQGMEKRIEFPNPIFTIGEETEDSNEYSETFSDSQLTSDEEEYLTEYRACLEDDGVITDRERRLLDRIRKSLGISEERARELEASCEIPSFTEEEQEYADEIRACLEEGGCISDRERRLLNKLRISLGISESRANEIEALVK